jgi:hypothetical protein
MQSKFVSASKLTGSIRKGHGVIIKVNRVLCGAITVIYVPNAMDLFSNKVKQSDCIAIL